MSDVQEFSVVIETADNTDYDLVSALEYLAESVAAGSTWYRLTVRCDRDVVFTSYADEAGVMPLG